MTHLYEELCKWNHYLTIKQVLHIFPVNFICVANASSMPFKKYFLNINSYPLFYNSEVPAQSMGLGLALYCNVLHQFQTNMQVYTLPHCSKPAKVCSHCTGGIHVMCRGNSGICHRTKIVRKAIASPFRFKEHPPSNST